MNDISKFYIIKEKKEENQIFERFNCIHTETGIDRDIVLINSFLSNHPQFKEIFKKTVEEIKQWDNPHIEKIIDYGIYKERISYISNSKDEKPLTSFVSKKITISSDEIISIGTLLLDIVEFFNKNRKPLSGTSLSDIRINIKNNLRIVHYPIYISLSSLPSDTTGFFILNPEFYAPELSKGITFHPASNLYWWTKILISLFPSDIENISVGIPPDFQTLFNNILKEDPKQRPSFEEVKEKVNSYLSNRVGKSTTDFVNRIMEKQKKLITEETEEKLLGRFQIIKKIGQGGMGTVVQAYDEILERYVAIKMIPIHGIKEEKLKKVGEEAKLIAKLNHPNIVNVFDVFEDENYLYIIMEYIEGISLEKIIGREVKLPYERVINIVISIAEALDYAHQRGIVHKDIKPANIIITRTGTVKIVDFGIAGLIEFKEEDIKGTPSYMSPEQIKMEEIDNRTDIFSLGIIFYQLLSGKNPFLGTNISQTIYNIINKEPEKIENIDKNLWKVIEKMLAKDSDKRYSAIEEFINDVKINKIYRIKERKRPKLWTIITLPFLILGILFLSYMFLSQKVSISEVIQIKKGNNYIIGVRRDGRNKWRLEFTDSISIISPFSDFDNNGEKEIIVGTAETKNTTHGASGYMINNKGKKIWEILNFGRYFKVYEEEENIFVKEIYVENYKNKKPIVIFNVKGTKHTLLLFSDFYTGEEIYRLLIPGKVMALYAKDIDRDTVNEFIVSGTNELLGNKPVIFSIEIIDYDVTEETPPWETKIFPQNSSIIWYTFLKGDAKFVKIVPYDSLFIIKNGNDTTIVDAGGRILLKDSNFIGGTVIDNKVWQLLKMCKETQLQNYKKCLAKVNKIKNVNPYIKSAIFYYIADALFKNEKSKEAKYYLKQAITLDKNFKQPYKLLSKMYEYEGKYTLAIKYFKKVFSEDSIENISKLVELYLLKGDIKSALSLLEKKYLSEKEKSKIDIIYARVLHYAGEIDRAISIYEMAIKYGKWDKNTIINLADAYAEKQENINRADSLLKSVISKDTLVIPPYGYIIGWINYTKGKIKQAEDEISASLNYYKAYEQLKPSYRLLIPEIMYRKIIVLKKRGKISEARSLIKAVKKYPLFGYYKEKINTLKKGL